jgi:hypothetical protein
MSVGVKGSGFRGQNQMSEDRLKEKKMNQPICPLFSVLCPLFSDFCLLTSVFCPLLSVIGSLP